MTSTGHELEQQLPISSSPEIVLDPKQEEAIEKCCNLQNRVVAITGAAGSGKTTIMKKAYEQLTAAGYNVALAAPTGKAAKRINEVTGIPAMTVHRLLEYTHPGDPDPKTGKPVEFSYPRRTRQNPLEVDIVFCDEYAMVAWEQHNALFAALPNAGCIRVFGDNNQLPPIEEGQKWDAPKEPSPFETLLNKFPATILETVHRQGKDSGILLNLQSILRGKMPTKNDQWTMHYTDQPVDKLTNLILDKLDQEIDFTSADCQILTTQNKSWIGTVKLNAMIQGMFHNKLDPSTLVPRHKWVNDGAPIPMFVGDKVIVTTNMYDLNLFNGESGKIIEISNYGEITIDFGDKEQVVPPSLMVQNRYGKTVEVDPRRSLDLGYVITTHKSQGSEYREVIYMLNKSTGFMQNRKNFYTACSRGREHVTIITDQVSVSTSLYKRG